MTRQHVQPGEFARAAEHAEAEAPARPFERRRRAAVPVAIASLVGLVVLTGSGVAPSLATDPGPQPLTVVLPSQPVAPEPAPAPAPAPEPPVEDLSVDETFEPAPVELAPAPPVDAAPAPLPAEPAPVEESAPAADETEQAAAEEEPGASPIRHVFLVVLGDADVAALARDAAAAPYLAETLKPSGTLLTEYRTVASGALANGVALVSGQGPTQQTLADCPAYGDVRPADPAADGQVAGDGCVYGYETGTLADQVRGLGREWRAYVDPAAPASSDPTQPTDPAQPAAPGAPQTGGADACGGPEATRRNPFLAFHAVIDDAEECARRNVGLDQLAADLADAARTPALAYVTSAAPVGSAGADSFLRRVVPQLLDSPAYAAGGLIVITSDRPAPPAGTTPTPGPGDTTAAPAPGTTTTTPAPASTTPAPATTTPSDPAPTGTTTTTPAPASTTPAPATTTPSDLAPTGTTTPAPAGTTPAATTPAPAPVVGDPVGPVRYPNVGDAAAAGAGQRVGALLLSPFVAAGRVEETPASHFAMLRTLSDLLGVEPLGYAGAESVAPLPDRLFLPPTDSNGPTR